MNIFSSSYLYLTTGRQVKRWSSLTQQKISPHCIALTLCGIVKGYFNIKNIKTTILILFLVLGYNLFAQTDKTKARFYLYYGVAGLGSSLGGLMPTVEVRGNKFRYTKEQNSYFVKRSKRIKFISSGSIRRSSIDSILSLINGLKNSTIYKTNHCRMGGGITYVIIANGSDTTKFTLHNTSDYIVLKIVGIINPYLPEDKELYESIQDIKDEEECWRSLSERVEKSKPDSLRPGQ